MIEGFIQPPAENKIDEKLFSDIEQHGLHVLGILGEEDQPPYAFSIGLYLRQHHPEILLMGLRQETARDLINDAAALINEGARFQPGTLYNEIIKGYQVAFLEVDRSHYREYLGYANWFYKSLPSPYPVLQMVWPDEEGRFPWEDGYDEALRDAQPLLGPAP